MNPIPVRIAKLSAPRLQGHVRRERLNLAFDQIADRQATWVCGPPGSGKTTAVAGWLETRGVAALWYRLDDGDRDPASLFDHLRTLARTEFGDGANRLPYFASDYHHDLAGFSRRFFRDWFALSDRAVTLVLDDHHEAACDTFDLVLRECIREIPRHARLIVATRSDLPPMMMREVAGRVLGTIGWPTLRFTDEETTAVLAATRPDDLTAAAEIQAAADGWVAGIVLLGASPWHRGAVAAAPRHNADAVFAYFAEEVFERWPAGDRETLMRIACFGQCTAGMAFELTGSAGCGPLLESLWRRHYFVERDGDDEPRYRFHDLFRAFLIDRGRRRAGPEAWNEALAKAAGILDARGEFAAAAELLIECEDWQRLAGIVVRYAREMLSRGRSRAVIGWLEPLPASLFQADPWLLYWYGMARCTHDESGGRDLLAAAYDGFRAAGNVLGQAAACADSMDTYFRHWNSVATLDRWIENMNAILQHEAMASGSLRDRSLVSLATALFARQPSAPALQGYVEEILQRLADLPDTGARVGAAAFLFHYFSVTGQFARLDTVAGMTRSGVESPECPPVQAFQWWNYLGNGELYRGNTDVAKRAHANALAIAQQHALHDKEFVAVFAQCLDCTDAGELTQSDALLETLRRTLDPRFHQHVVGYHYLEHWVAVVSGDDARARRIWDSFGRVPAAGVPINTAYNQPAVWFLVRDGDAAGALERVERWDTALRGMNSPYIDFNVAVMRASALLALGREAQFKPELERLFGIGARYRFRTTLSWVPAMMAELCAAALARGIQPEYVGWLMRERGLRASADDVKGGPASIAIHVLGEFRVVRNQTTITFSHRAPRKPLALLKSIVAAGRKGLAGATACHWLWPDLEGDAAEEALTSALHRLRRLLDCRDAVHLSEGVLRLDETLVRVDAFGFEDAADDVERQQTALDLYAGALLPHDDEPWTMIPRARLRSRFVGVVSALAGGREAAGAIEDALACYRRGIEIDALAEPLYQGAMRCLARSGRRAEAEMLYRQLRDALAAELGVAPSEQSMLLAGAR